MDTGPSLVSYRFVVCSLVTSRCAGTVTLCDGCAAGPSASAAHGNTGVASSDVTTAKYNVVVAAAAAAAAAAVE